MAEAPYETPIILWVDSALYERAIMLTARLKHFAALNDVLVVRFAVHFDFLISHPKNIIQQNRS
jgi:hypothetical protein